MAAPPLPTPFPIRTRGTPASGTAPSVFDVTAINAIFTSGNLSSVPFAALKKPEDIDELFNLLNKQDSTVVNDFIKQWPGLTLREFKLAFNDDSGVGAPSDGHPSWSVLKLLFATNARENAVTKTTWTQPALSVNANDLHIALLYPGVASYLKKVRARMLNNAFATVSPYSPFYPGLPYSAFPRSKLEIHLKGGEQLNANYPIEMRGFGPLLASSMRGGNTGLLTVGNVNSPTIWRPISDDSFISESLFLAVQKLVQKLKANGMNLEAAVENKIDQRMADLQAAETRAKNLRDKLDFAAKQFVGVGTSNSFKDGILQSGKLVGNAELEGLRDAYNDAIKAVQKNEGVILKVIDRMGKMHEF